MYKPEKGKPFFCILKFLNFFHYYPLNKLTNTYKYISVFIRLITCFCIVQCLIHSFVCIKDQIPVDISEDIVGLTGMVNCQYICVSFQLDIHKWSKLYSDITNTTKFGTPPNLAKKSKKIQLYTTLFIIYCNGGVIIYALTSIFLESEFCKRLNREKGLHEICGMATPFWWPYDEIDPYVKLFFIMYQITCIGIYIPPGVCLLFSTWECAEIIVVKINHLKKMFKETFEIKEPHLQQAHFRRCIQYHQEIIRMCYDWNSENKKCFGQCSFISGITVSFITAQFLRVHSIGALIHLVGYTLGVFFLCKAGQLIQDESYNIQDALSDSKWYNSHPSLLKDVKFVILRCQKPIYLQAVPFGTFNYSLLIIILKTAYSYLTLINNETNHDLI